MIAIVFVLRRRSRRRDRNVVLSKATLRRSHCLLVKFVAVLENECFGRHIGHIEFDKLYEAERRFRFEGEIGERPPDANPAQFLSGAA